MIARLRAIFRRHAELLAHLDARRPDVTSELGVHPPKESR